MIFLVFLTVFISGLFFFSMLWTESQQKKFTKACKHPEVLIIALTPGDWTLLSSVCSFLYQFGLYHGTHICRENPGQHFCSFCKRVEITLICAWSWRCIRTLRLMVLCVVIGMRISVRWMCVCEYKFVCCTFHLPSFCLWAYFCVLSASI